MNHASAPFSGAPPRPAVGGGDTSAPDSALLDEAFDLAVASWESGREPSVPELVIGRPDLASRLEEIVELAREVAIVRPSALSPPRIPGFAVLHEIGRGAMGVVYLARQQSLGGRAVALKVLSEGSAGSARARDRFQREANAVARLRHPNIVGVHDVVREGPIIAMAMEVVEGASLQSLIDALGQSQSPLTSDDVRRLLGAGESALAPSPYWTVIARIGVAIARALEAVHAAGLFHRDVKPSNILLRRDGTPLLSDFGLVRDPESPLVTQPGFVGTVAYAPPEQLEGSGTEPDARGDVYALGVTLFHALAFRVPIPGRTPVQVLEQIGTGAPVLRAAPPRVPSLPRDLATIIEKAMSPRPADRYPSAGALADDLERLLEERPIEAKRSGVFARAIKYLRRNRQSARGVLLGAAAVALVTATAFFALVTMPRWAAQAREEAWLTLLDPRDTVTVADAAFFEEQHNGPPLVNRDLARRALIGYDSALRWQPWDARIRLERDAIAAALSVGDSGRTPPDFSDFLRQSAPRACDFLTGWSACAPNDPPPAIPPEPNSPEELTAIAMMSGVTRTVAPAIECWQRLERLADPGPFVHAGLGLYFLYDQQPGRAYPRLDRAAQAFPDVSYIQAALAEAACAEGDLDRAEFLLEHAQALPRADASQLIRVDILNRFARGPTDDAIRHFESVYYRSGPLATSSVTGYQIGRWLAEHDRPVEAVRALASAIGSPPPPRVSRLFVPLAEQWWDTLDDAQRIEAVLGVIRKGRHVQPPSDSRVLIGYCVAVASPSSPADAALFAARHHDLARIVAALDPALGRQDGTGPLDGVSEPQEQRRWALAILASERKVAQPGR